MNAPVFVSALLDCGYLDTDYLFRLADAYGLDPRDLAQDVHEVNSGMPHINELIYVAFERIAQQFLDQLPSRTRLHAITLEYSIFTNCMDS